MSRRMDCLKVITCLSLVALSCAARGADQLTKEQTTCQIWGARVVLHTNIGNFSSITYIHAPTLTVLLRKQEQANLPYPTSFAPPLNGLDPKAAILSALVPGAVPPESLVPGYQIGTTSGKVEVQLNCAVSGSEAQLASDNLRAVLEAEVQKTVKSTVEAQLATFLAKLKEVSDQDRKSMIDAALKALPENATLVEALRTAVAAQAKQ